jgi:hypothetical protein
MELSIKEAPFQHGLEDSLVPPDHPFRVLPRDLQVHFLQRQREREEEVLMMEALVYGQVNTHFGKMAAVSLSLSLTHTHTHTHTFSVLALSLSRSLTHTHTHSLSLRI